MSIEKPTPQFLIAAARRILANEGCFSYVQGHVSLRAQDRESFWVTPWGYQDETLPRDISRVTMELRKVEGRRESSAGIEFHSAIYQARPDINCVIHDHSHWVQVLSTTDRVVDMYSGESGIVYGLQTYGDVGQNFKGENAHAIAASLGTDKSILILPHHGYIVTGSSVEEATVRAIMLEHGARLQIEAELIGGKPFVPEEQYIQGFRTNVLPQIWDACYRRLRRTDPDLFDDGADEWSEPLTSIQ